MCSRIYTKAGNRTQFNECRISYRTFGTEHVGVNYGLIVTGLIIISPTGVLLPTTLQDIVGWNGMFVIIAVFCTIGESQLKFLQCKKTHDRIKNKILRPSLLTRV